MAWPKEGGALVTASARPSSWGPLGGPQRRTKTTENFGDADAAEKKEPRPGSRGWRRGWLRRKDAAAGDLHLGPGEVTDGPTRRY